MVELYSYVAVAYGGIYMWDIYIYMFKMVKSTNQIYPLAN